MAKTKKALSVSRKQKTIRMAQTAVLAAIIIIMAFTPLGYLKIGTLSISFLSIPVALGAVLVGPGAGTFLGFVFGMTSFLQCFGYDPFGTMLAGSSTLSAVKMFAVCALTRTLMGFLTAIIFKGLSRVDKTRFFSYLVPCLCSALLNTLLFIGTLWLLFRNDPLLVSGLGLEGTNLTLISIFTIVAGVNALIEIPTAAVVGTAISIPVSKALKKLG